MVPFEKRDLAHCENLIRAIKKAKFELDGMEVLAFAEVMKWINNLYVQIQAEVESSKNPPIAALAKEAISPVAEESTPPPPVKTPKRTTKQ